MGLFGNREKSNDGRGSQTIGNGNRTIAPKMSLADELKSVGLMEGFELLFQNLLPKVNEAFSQETKLFDEIVIFRDHSLEGEKFGHPYYVYHTDECRTDQQGYSYSKDAQKIMTDFLTQKDKKYGQLITNNDCDGTNFDAMVAYRSGFFVFFNNKKYKLSEIQDKGDYEKATKVLEKIIKLLNSYLDHICKETKLCKK